MTTQTEALKLARQLLWRYRHETPIGNQPHMICQEVDDAFERIDEALAQPEQEPVAWMYPDALCDRSCLYVCTKAFTQFPECATTPPQRKQLTDAMVSAAARVLNNRQAEACGVDKDDQWKVYGEDFIEDARAMLTAAHGIKE